MFANIKNFRLLVFGIIEILEIQKYWKLLNFGNFGILEILEFEKLGNLGIFEIWNMKIIFQTCSYILECHKFGINEQGFRTNRSTE